MKYLSAILVGVLLSFILPNTVGAVQWPRGQFSLPQPASGCPTGMSSGWRYQDNEDNNNENHWIPGDIQSCINMEVGRNLKTYYCSKTSDTGSSSWPSGTYCIARHGSSCPSGFTSGLIHWDDEDNANANTLLHPLPSGRYDRNTEIDFCCRSDGGHSSPMTLPTTETFALYRYQGKCQKVSGMNDPIELFVHYDDEDSNNANRCSGNHPGGSCIRNHELYFCYYTPSSTNKCNVNPCQNGGTCTSLNYLCKGYECSCPTNYKGTNCEHLFGQLQVRALYGRDLPDEDPWLNDSDPYLQVTAYDENGNSLTKSTAYIAGDQSPDWNELLDFGKCKWKRFNIRVYDSDVNEDDPLSAQHTITLTSTGSYSNQRLDCYSGHVMFEYSFT